MSIRFIDKGWNWRDDKLIDFLYKHGNIPYGYEEFFMRDDVMKRIYTISGTLYERANNDINIYPLMEDTFKAFRCRTPKALIIGMDPYHNPSLEDPSIPGSATGLCFSLPYNSSYINPSFRNIMKEVRNCGYRVEDKCGDLSRWCDDGVLLLNTALTVEEARPNSHTALWSGFTTLLIEYLSMKYDMVCLLWGKNAQEYEGNIKEGRYILKYSHPMPLAANRPCGGSPPFLGSKWCILTNRYLQEKGYGVIDFSIP